MSQMCCGSRIERSEIRGKGLVCNPVRGRQLGSQAGCVLSFVHMTEIGIRAGAWGQGKGGSLQEKAWSWRSLGEVGQTGGGKEGKGGAR